MGDKVETLWSNQSKLMWPLKDALEVTFGLIPEDEKEVAK